MQEQTQVTPCLYDEISGKTARKKKVKTSKKAKKSIKIQSEASVSVLSTKDEYVSIKRKKSATLLKAPEAYSNLRKESVGPGFYEEISITENDGEQANFIVEGTYANTTLVRPVSKRS
ncbi:uncharacterized protein LOC133192752 [Saccostrea echinata]|uniref:uncharacterized protein LOC133192752 n=1 Tax=Saccostrea echinata TaxID=191078 RepID=UPI002A7EBABB|nr:uncharacterized protein LOC133192752 [Saccostrea echinata]